MRYRIFIAINLPEDIKRKLISRQEKIEKLFTPHLFQKGGGPIRWTKKENLHITLIFIGYVPDEELLEICKVTREVASRNSAFSINLNKICYGPPKKIPYSATKSLTGRLDKVENRPPKMVWIEGEKSEELGILQQDLENSLFAASIKGLEREARPYTPHLTLGRIKQWEFRQIEPEERPVIEEEISLNFSVESIEVIESELKRGGPKYIILETCNLKPET